MFWAKKIVCDQCSKKVKEKGTVYARGSRFCTETCRSEYDIAHPPTIARGEPDALRNELVICLDEAFTEAQRRWGSEVTKGFSFRIGVGPSHVGALLAGIDAKHHEEQMQEAFMQFQTHLFRSGPLLRALGYTAEAQMIDSTDFQTQSPHAVIAALGNVRAQL
jgi:hypothetical protein